MMQPVILHCPELGRDISAIQAAVPDAIVYRSPRTPHGHDGCILGHQAIVAMARAQCWPSVWILEDDCRFTEAFCRARFEVDTAWANSRGYTVITGGAFSAANPVQHGAGFAVDRFKSTHCVVYAAAAYDIVDRVVEPIDLNLGKLGARCFVVYPFVAVQAPGFSGIQDKDVDYGSGYERHSARLAELAVTW